MDITPALTTFGLIAVAELGDKTQLIAIALSARYSRIHVFAGMLCAFIVLTALAVGVGEFALNFISPHIINMAAGILFILFGILTFVWNDDDTDILNNSRTRGAFMAAFSMIALAELGDKTQLAVLTLSARYHAPLMVFLGAVLALGLIGAIGVMVGDTISNKIPMKKIRMGSGILFILYGLVFMLKL